MRSRPALCLIILSVCVAALPGCRRGPISATDAGALSDAGAPDAGTPIIDSGPDEEPIIDPEPVVDAGPEPVIDAGPDEIIDAGPDEDPPPTGEVGVPVRIGFDNDPIIMQAGECSGAYPDVPRLRVAVLDGPGNAVAVDEDVHVTLSSTSGTLRFFTDSTCMQNVGQITIPAGSSGVPVTLYDVNPGEPTIYGSASEYTRGEQTITVTPN